MTTKSEPSVVLFDGVCNVCNASVNFIIDHDAHARFRFASLQSDVGKRLCSQYGISEDVRTIVLIQDGVAYTESNAVLRVAKGLGGGWPIVYMAMAVPRGLRDFVYRKFSANRYQWFGKTDACRVPTPDIRARFLTS